MAFITELLEEVKIFFLLIQHRVNIQECIECGNDDHDGQTCSVKDDEWRERRVKDSKGKKIEWGMARGEVNRKAVKKDGDRKARYIEQ